MLTPPSFPTSRPQTGAMLNQFCNAKGRRFVADELNPLSPGCATNQSQRGQCTKCGLFEPTPKMPREIHEALRMRPTPKPQLLRPCCAECGGRNPVKSEYAQPGLRRSCLFSLVWSHAKRRSQNITIHYNTIRQGEYNSSWRK